MNSALTEEEVGRLDRQIRVCLLTDGILSVLTRASLNIGMGFRGPTTARYTPPVSCTWTDLRDRMRNATILVVQLKGTATEVIKNIVLSGIGKLVIVDEGEVLEEDLGSGFFFRDGDVGKKVLSTRSIRLLAGIQWCFFGV